MEIGQKIYYARKKKGFTQEKLGILVNSNGKYIGMIERGERRPSYELLKKLCDVLEVSADYLLGREIYEEAQVREALKGLTKDEIQKFIKILETLQNRREDS